MYRFLDDADLTSDVVKVYATLAQARARVAYQEHCPIGELLASGGESAHLEFKATLRTHAASGEVYKPLETATLKTVAAFANSRSGGTLLIGVADDGTVTGLATDYASLAMPGKDPRDQFMLHVSNLLVASTGETAAADVSLQIHTVDGQDLCRVHVQPSSFPVDAVVTVDRKGQLEKKTAFYVRTANATREIAAAEERQRYIAARRGKADVQRTVE